MAVAAEDLKRAQCWEAGHIDDKAGISTVNVYELMAAYAAHVTAELRQQLAKKEEAAEHAVAAAYKRGLEDAARIAENPGRAGRDWVPGSLWGNIINETTTRIRALAKTDGQA